jgi:DNA polymerase III subunit epsilon
MKFLLNRPVVFFDLETTGIAHETCRIVQFAGVKIFPDRSQKEYNFLINPIIPIPYEASNVHGIFDKDVANAPTFKELSLTLLEILADCDLGGFNIMSYDVPVLLSEFGRVGIGVEEFKPFDRRYFDVRNIYNRVFERTLSAIYKQYMGKDIDGAHDAMNDVKATLEVFGEMLNQHEAIPKTPAELDLYSSYDNPRADVSGWFYKDADGQYRFSRGKYKDDIAMAHYSYILWMLEKGNFPPDTVYIAQKIRKAILTKKGIDEV